MSNEYLTANESIAYPFKDDSPGLAPIGDPGAVSPVPYLPRDFFLDMVLSMTPRYSTVYLKSIWFDIDHIMHLRFSYDGTSYITSVNYDMSGGVPQDRDVIRVPGPTGALSMVAVAGPGLASYAAMAGWGIIIEFGDRLPVETAVVEIRPDRMTAFMVSSSTVTGEVRLQEGHNCGLTQTSGDIVAPGRDGTPISISLSQGLGEGQYPTDCGESSSSNTVIGALAGVSPDGDGNITIDPGDCHSIIPLGNGMIQIINRCMAACTCDQYAAVVEAIRALFVRAAAVKDALESATADLNDQVTEWNDGGGCQKKNLKILRLEGAVGSFMDGGVAEDSEYATVSVRLMTLCESLPEGLTVSVAADWSEPSGDLYPVSGFALGNGATVPMSVSDMEDLFGVGYTVPDRVTGGNSLQVKALVRHTVSAHVAAAVAEVLDLDLQAEGVW